jgi:hypothetical protein
MKKLVSRIAFALALVAAPTAVLAPSRPAHACGPYADTPELRVRRAALQEARRSVGDGGTATIHSVRIEGGAARVVVRFQRAGGGRATVQALFLNEDSGGGWRVTGRSYVLDGRSVALLETLWRARASSISAGRRSRTGAP